MDGFVPPPENLSQGAFFNGLQVAGLIFIRRGVPPGTVGLLPNAPIAYPFKRKPCDLKRKPCVLNSKPCVLNRKPCV
jgi:hypothetical protein